MKVNYPFDPPIDIDHGHQDWRFKHHPLVTGPPYIRFFAAVPILAETGEVMGVFAVFDERPKKTFDRKARDILDSFGRDLTGDFRHLTFKEKGWSLLHGKDHVMTGVPNSKLRFYGMLMRERPEVCSTHCHLDFFLESKKKSGRGGRLLSTWDMDTDGIAVRVMRLPIVKNLVGFLGVAVAITH